GADDQPVGVELAPAVERDVGERRRRRDGRVDVARNERELVLERQVVEQDLADRLRRRNRLGVLRQRDEFGYGDARRLTALAGDRRDDVGRLRRGLRGLLRRRLLRVQHGNQTGEREGCCWGCPFHR